jgi:Zn-dependent protease
MVSFRIGSVFGIPIRLGISFLLVVPLLAYLIGLEIEAIVETLNLAFGTAIAPELLAEGMMPWVLGLVASLGLFVSVLLHELGHSLVARLFGFDTEAITLWFLGGLAQFTEIPKDWRHELAIAIAGPIVSVALGVLCYAAFVQLSPELPAVLFVLGYLAVLNVVLAGFNMLPGFPMDGGRVLRALLSRNRSRLEATHIAAGVGKWFAILLGIGGILLVNIFWIAIAFFIYLAATSETRQAVVEASFGRLTVDEIMTPASELDTVSPETSLDDLVNRMIRERHTGYPVLDDGELVGIVTLEDLQEHAPEGREGTVRDVMSPDPVTVPRDTEAITAFRTLQREGIGRIIVTEDDGSVAGLISRTDLMTVFQITQTGRSMSVTPQSIEP